MSVSDGDDDLPLAVVLRQKKSGAKRPRARCGRRQGAVRIPADAAAAASSDEDVPLSKRVRMRRAAAEDAVAAKDAAAEDAAADDAAADARDKDAAADARGTGELLGRAARPDAKTTSRTERRARSRTASRTESRTERRAGSRIERRTSGTRTGSRTDALERTDERGALGETGSSDADRPVGKTVGKTVDKTVDKRVRTSRGSRLRKGLSNGVQDVKLEAKAGSETTPDAKSGLVDGAETAVDVKPGRAHRLHRPTPPLHPTELKPKNGEQFENEDEDEDEALKWFKREGGGLLGDGTEKWKTFSHNGVLFPPPYQPLPEGVKMLYDGMSVSLPPAAEEVAGFFAAMLNTDYAQNPTFQQNFFDDFKAVCIANGVKSVQQFSKCDFKPMFDHYQQLKEIKKKLPLAERKAEKKKREEAEAKYKYCLVDGHKEAVGNYRVEPPSLFRGRGAHPKTGKLKLRVMPGQITINIGEDEKIPDPPPGHRWQEVRHDNTVTWLAMWKENINGALKYVFLAPGSRFKGQSDIKKYEKARRLKDYIVQIRKNYTKDLKSDVMLERQRATAMALIDIYALRAGNEKGEDEADTVGCCSLRVEHVRLTPPNKVLFDFLGKDSIRYVNEVEVPKEIYKNLKLFQKTPKTPSSLLFDRLSTTLLNAHLNKEMPGLSAKVFRTYNASVTMQEQLVATPETGTVAEKLLAYNRANRRVAILCNHQRTVPKGHENSLERLEYNIKAAKYQKIRIKRKLLYLHLQVPLLKEHEIETVRDLESDIDEGWIVNHQLQLIENSRSKITKWFEKENTRRHSEASEGKIFTLLSEADLKMKLESLDALRAEFEEENRNKVIPLKRTQTEKAIRDKLSKINDRIHSMKMQRTDKEENKTTALGTSKINYIDPRITVAWARKVQVPIEKLFNASLRTKFAWAIEDNNIDASWRF